MDEPLDYYIKQDIDKLITEIISTSIDKFISEEWK
tara:strand:+ start:1227 stop:1331 length:105 start_codon:yes stop_codon:yes gene_type:complete